MNKPSSNIPSIDKLKAYYEDCRTRYGNAYRQIQLLDAADRGDFWKSINMKFPEYQILPDTNFISYVKNNILASVYTVTKSATIEPTSEQDKDLVANLNIILEHLWNTANVGYLQFQAGERAALTNMGITQVGWSEDFVRGAGSSFQKGEVVMRNIDPTKFMRDPYAVDLETAGYCMTFEDFHESIFLENKNYEKEFKNYKAKLKAGNVMTPITMKVDRADTQSSNEYYTLIVFWVRQGKKVHEIHTVNAEHILYVKEDIKPSTFPFAILYCNLPAGGILGKSEPAKIYSNYVVYNLMDSIALTAEYKNQNPPRFVNQAAGLNIAAFAKRGNEANHTFVVQGDASKAVHYHQFPTASAMLPVEKQALSASIQQITGVDGKYTGRDTGSVITTGGVEEMMGRATLIDQPKILNYEAYTKRLTQLVLANLIAFCPKRKYFVKKPNSTEYSTIEVDFPKIDDETAFDYSLDVTSELPRNKTRIAQMATQLMEKQMQYGSQGNVDLITPEEWLMLQDIPYKEYFSERMGIQRLNNTTEEVASTLVEYATLVQNGATPDEAIQQTANTLDARRKGEPIEPIPMQNPLEQDLMPQETPAL